MHVISVPARRPSGWRYRIQRMLRRIPAWVPPTFTPLLDVLGDRHVIVAEQMVAERDVPDGDIVVATWWQTAEWVNALPASKGRKFYLLQDYELFENQPADRVSATYALDLRKIAVSSYIRDRILAAHDVQGDIAVVPNAVDLTHFSVQARQRNRQFKVGVLYATAPRKNIRLAIEALERARHHNPGLRALLFGAIPISADLPLPDWVEYHEAPDQADIPQLYASCDLWLFPSREEGFGLPILEAMACRTPVLATDAGAAPDLIDGRNGRILPHDPEAFAAAILEFARMSPQDWRSWSDAAFDTASHNRWDDATDRLLAVIGR
ncbi:glycosyltransferase family 4 protein [Seohaeicola nanhaiensis]|uniref:Glycosyltransferase family 4 protein n=2 Tax=Seohaeicola nanhaiensis TaxID=1387282 RepID=A0ABV9KLI5_9RHOB